MRALADWLMIDVPDDRWPVVADACCFETVKANPGNVVGEMAD